ncbi:MFS transporter [Thermomonospora umbrina]|uniref:MFS transporter n=1 Tax=Thermomonospora umbrina TaxID=111806 RepID=A0A3D9T1D3_9ACTN|nr:MFS transporter [Thermomonospora umbrina]REE99045.1 MFS transporter [Thermomonospora umbrina]
MSTLTTAVPRKEGGRPHAAVTLVVVLVGVFAVAMSIAGTGIALPRIGQGLDASGATLQWAVTAYNLALSAFTLVCGSLADLFGRRRTFVAATALFTLGSLLTAAAPNILVLDAARALAGIGAGGVMACGGALLAATFEGPARTRAFAAMGMTGGAGVVVGPFLAGWLVTRLGWRPSFLVFVLVGLLILAGSRAAPESRADHRPPVDVRGAVTFVAGLGTLMYGLIRLPDGGPVGPAGLVVGAVLLTVFVLVSRRTADPVLDLTMIRNPRFMGWTLGTLSTSVGFVGTLVYLPIYFQGVDGATAREAGQTMLMMTAPIMVVPIFAGWLVAKGVSARALMTLALLLVAGGNAWLTVLEPGMGAPALLGPLLTVGVGMGVSFGITDAQAMNQVEPARVGMAAGFLNTVRNSGEALVIAVFGTVLVALIQARVGSADLADRIAAGDLSGADRALNALRYTESWHIALWWVAGICAAAAVVVAVLLSRPGRDSGTPEREDGTAPNKVS